MEKGNLCTFTNSKPKGYSFKTLHCTKLYIVYFLSFQFPPLSNVQATAWHIAQPYFSDGVQECSVVVFGGNAYVNKTLPGSPRIAVNNLKIFEFGKLTGCSNRIF